MTMNHVHQERLFDPRNASKLIQLGAGSVGSWVVLLAAKAGIHDIELWDFDIVKSHNIPLSIFGPQHLGWYKVDAVADVVKYMTGIKIVTRREAYKGEPLRRAVVVSSVDKMDKENNGRKLIWPEVRWNPSVNLFCDTRTAAAFVEAYCIETSRDEDIERYEATLCSDAEVALQTCGNHGIAYASARVAAATVANITNYWERGKKCWRHAERCDTLERAD